MQIQPRFSSAFWAKTDVQPDNVMQQLREVSRTGNCNFSWLFPQFGGDLLIGTGPDKEHEPGMDKFQVSRLSCTEWSPTKKGGPPSLFDKLNAQTLLEQELNRKIHQILQEANISYEFLP